MTASVGTLNRWQSLVSALRLAALASWLKAKAAALVAPAPPTLGLYQQRRAPARATVRKWFVVSLIIFVGMIYGFFVAIFPLFLYLYMAMPIAFLALLVVWALPETDNPPVRVMEWLFWAFFVALFLWPNYLAIALPGLPWITMIRAFTAPMVLFLLVSLSIAPSFRHTMMAIFRESPWLSKFMLGFVVLQVITIAFSKHMGDSFNRFLSNQLEWTAAFAVAAFVFTKPGRVELWARLLCLMAALMSAVAFFEYRKGGVLWAEHIPSFLVVADESIQRVLAGGARAATGIYRLQSTFVTSLNFAEFLGLSTALFLHFLVETRRSWLRLLIIAYLPYHFWVIWGTDSRLGMVGFFGSLLAYLLVWSIRRWRTRRHDIFAPALVLAYPAVLAAFMVATLVWQKLNRMIWGGGPQAASNDARKAQWAALWPKLREWPFGHGPAQSGDALGFVSTSGVITIDSYYISILMDYGVFGFFAFYGMLLVAIVQSYQLSSTAYNADTKFALPVFVILSNFIVVKGVLSQDDSHAMIFMLLGVVVALRYRAKQESSTPSALPAQASSGSASQPRSLAIA